MSKGALFAACVGGLTATVATWSCLDPTQITLRLTTDLSCDEVATHSASIYGELAPRADASPLTTTRDCSAGEPRNIGSLVVVPSGDRGDAFAVTVVAGVTRASEDCAAAGFAGCIVARRRVAYAAHKRLELPILLSRSCLDVACPDATTCVPCTNAAACAAPRCAPVDAPSACDDPAAPGCAHGTVLGAAAIDAGGVVDGGAVDAAGGDAGAPNVFTLVQPSNLPIYGLAAVPPVPLPSRTLYWSTAKGFSGASVQSAPLGASTAASTVFQVDGGESLAGLDVVETDAGDIVVAAEPTGSNSAVARKGPKQLSFVGTPSTGVAVLAMDTVDFGKATLFLTPSAGTAWVRVAAADNPTTAVATGYARYLGAAAHQVIFAAGVGISTYDTSDGGIAKIALGPSNRTVRAVAVSGRTLFVTVAGPQTPTVYIKTPTTDWAPFGHIEGQPEGDIPGAEDLLVVNDSGAIKLFVAGQAGVWAAPIAP